MRYLKRYIPLLCTLLVAACDGPQNVMEGAGPAADGLAVLGGWILWTFVAVTLIVWALIAWVALRRRGSFDEHAPVTAGGGKGWILIGGFAIPAAILSIVFISAMASIRQFPLSDGGDSAPELQVVGRQWWFEALYPRSDGLGTIPSATEIHIPTGTAVDVELTTRDVIHSFWVPKVHGKVDLIPGRTNHIRLQVDQPGVYSGQCAEFCGRQHAHMRILVVAQEPKAFAAWRSAQALPAKPPRTATAQRGHDVFMSAACPVCHSIRGTPAHGNVGPDLTHLGSRMRIAGGMLDNNTANLSAWVTKAQSLKPGVAMPNINDFTGEDLTALVDYLQSLE